MGTRTETLRLQVVDDGSDAAKKFAEGLKKAEAQAKALAKAQEAGASGKFTSGLQRIGLAAKDVDKTTAAWERYARSVGVAGDKAKWTKAQAAQIRQWESSTVSALQNVQRAQKSTAATTRSLIEGMSGSGRAMGRHISTNRRLIEGMGAPSRASRVARESAARESAEIRAERAQTRADSRRLLLSGAGVYAGHKVQEGTAATLHTYRDFDKYSRQTEAFGNFSKAEMAKIIAMSIHGDKNTRFNDIQYLQGAKALGGRGVSASSVMGILPEAGYYGQAMGVDLPEAVAGLEGSLFGFQRDLSTAEKASAAARRTADLQVNAAKAFGLTHHDLKGGYEYGALGASMTGLSEEKLLAFIGLGKKLNIEGSAQGNAWRAMTGRYLTPTRKARESLAGVGIDYSKHQKMPERLSVDNFSNMIAQQYGAKLDKGARAKLEKAFTDQKTFGDAATFAVAVKNAVKGQVGVADAKSANKVVGSAERFRQNNVQKVDVNSLFDELLAKIGAGNLALANSIFGEKQGTRIMAALRDRDVWEKSVHKMEATPEGKAKEVSEKMSAGFEGASARWEKAKMNFETAMGRSWDNGGEGGLLTGVVDQGAKLVLALSELDSKVIQAASGVAWFGGKVAEGAGTLGLIGAAVSLQGSAAALTTAAGRMGIGGGIGTATGAGTAAGTAATGAGAAATGSLATTAALGGIGAGVLAGGAFGVYATAQEMPKIAAERGGAGRAFDPASGGVLEESPMAGMAPERPFIADWLRKKRAEWTGGDAAKLAPPEVKPKMDTTVFQAFEQQMSNVKDKATELNSLSISIPVNSAGLGTVIQQMQQIINMGPQVSASMSGAAKSAGLNAGKVSQALQNAPSTI